MIETVGTYYDTLDDGRVLVVTSMPPVACADEIRILWDDPEEITAAQRRKIFSLCGDIAVWSGGSVEYVRKNLQADFLRENLTQLQLTSISLASGGNCSKSTARMLIDYLINVILEYDIPTLVGLSIQADDIGQYVYACLIHKKCAVCGKKAELHHVDAIGAGYDRRTKPQLVARVLPLCREHHMEFHNAGEKAFNDKYHLEPVELDQRIAAVYKLTRAQTS